MKLFKPGPLEHSRASAALELTVKHIGALEHFQAESFSTLKYICNLQHFTTLCNPLQQQHPHVAFMLTLEYFFIRSVMSNWAGHTGTWGTAGVPVSYTHLTLPTIYSV